MRARFCAILAVGLLAGLAALLAPSASAESSPSAFGSRLVTLINQARAQQGLKALTVTGGTSTVAASWTQHLDQQQALSHNPNLGHQLETHGSPNWTAYGENVGDGPTSSADTLFQAYMNSPEHRDNILGSAYRYLGVGVVFDGSTAWNTLDFVDQYSSSTSTSKPRTSTPTTTAPKTHSAPRVAKPVARPVARPAVVHHAPARPVAHPRRQSARSVHVKAVASAVPAVVAPPIAEPVTTMAAAMPAPIHLPGTPRDTTPILAAAAAILLVVATRFGVEVFRRGA
jgi:hypothetical protein